AQTYLNTKEILSLKECSTMDYDPDLSQEDANKQASTLTESIIQNSKHPKEDTTVTSQQITEISIVPLKDEHSTIKTKQEDIYSFQWAFTRDEMEVSQKPTLGFKSKVKSIQFITLWDLPKEARIGTRRYNNIHDKKDKLRGSLSDKTNIGSSTQWKWENFGKIKPFRNIPERGALMLIMGAPVELMDMDKTKLPASNLIQNTLYYE
ncbi:22428_t:CDS:2, partial [Gigaspora rosea]